MNHGLLARVTLSRFDEDYGAIFDRPPCADGSGPYRWLLSPDCGLRDAINWPAEVTSALERAANGSETAQVTYEYSVLGMPSARVEDGMRWTFVRDPHGRPLETTTPNGVTTTVRRTPDGLPAWIETRHQPASGPPVLLARLRQTFSPGGLVLRSCRELTTDGCAGFENFAVWDNQPLPIGRAYQLTVREYDAADRLKRLVDPIGLVTEWDYNARGLPIRIRQRPQGGAVTPVRHTGYCYSDRGDPVRVLRGADVRDGICEAIRPPIVTSDVVTSPPGFGTPAPPQLTCPDRGPQRAHTEEVLAYDGLARITQRIDARKVRHRYRWTARDQLAMEEIGQPVCGPLRQGDAPTTITASSPLWCETAFIPSR